MLFYLQVQEWLCLNCQTQRAMSGQLGDIGKTPPTPSGPKSSPMPISTEQPSQKTEMPIQVKVKKEQEVKREVEKIILEKESPSVEKILPQVATDQKEEAKLVKDKTLAFQEKKPPPEDKIPPQEDTKLPTKEKKTDPEDRKSLPEEKKITPKDKKPIAEDKISPPGAKPSILEEEQKHDLLKTQVQIAEGKLKDIVTPKAMQDVKQLPVKMEGLPPDMPQKLPEDDETAQKTKEQPQAVCSAKPDQMEPVKEKSVSCVFLNLNKRI